MESCERLLVNSFLFAVEITPHSQQFPNKEGFWLRAPLSISPQPLLRGFALCSASGTPRHHLKPYDLTSACRVTTDMTDDTCYRIIYNTDTVQRPQARHTCYETRCSMMYVRASAVRI